MENLLRDDAFLLMARDEVLRRGLRVLATAAVGGKQGLKRYTEELVASQLGIHW